MSVILGRHLIDELIKQGIADDRTTRVTIDCPLNDPVRVYVEKIGDKRLLSIVPALAANGVEIHRELVEEAQITTLEDNDLDHNSH
jgi:hypothetical protein